MISHFIQTYTGKKFSLINPTPEMIDIEDIAHALSMTCRFGGHSKMFYSVAEHSYLVSRFVPEESRLAGLLHDSAEAYIGDMVSPLKRHMNSEKYKALEREILEAVYEKYNVQDFLDVKATDLLLLRVEANQVFNHKPIQDWDQFLPAWDSDRMPLPKPLILGFTPNQAKTIFLSTFNKLTGGAYNCG